MDDLIAQFSGITGASSEEAKFYLESSNGSVEEAIELYFSEKHDGGPRYSPTMAAALDPPAPKARPQPAPPQPSTAPAAKKAVAKPASKFRTLADMQGGGGDGGESGSEEDEDAKGTTTYAGGKSSGLAIQNPPKGKKSNEDITKEILDKAREHGAVDYNDWKKEKESTFKGPGYRLGALDTPAGEQTKPLKDTVKKERHFTINLWTDGFSVDDGELRKFDDPASKAFLESVNKGEIPLELQQQILREMDPKEGPPKIFVNLEQKNSPFEPPPKVFKAFTGSGRSLADPSSSSGGAAQVPASGSAPAAKHEVDESKPVTTLQIRLADGTRLQARFNLQHTVNDIRNLINRSRPQTRPYDIITTMPRQVFSDGAQTIESAGLKNAAVVQHLL